MFKKPEILSSIILTILVCIGLIVTMLICSSPSHRPGISLSESPRPSANPGITDGKININTADIEVLDILPAIGPKLAERIIQYRQLNGPFQAPEELLNVHGIGKTTLEKISPFITTGGTS